MMDEQVFLGECPIVRPEGIYYGGRKVISLGLGDVGDLLAYRQEWEPFISAHLALWRDMNNRFENSPDVTKCPSGIFTNAQIPQNLDPVWKSWCASLALTRMMTSVTSPDGILPRWNAWKDKSSAQILAGAADMLKWHQDVVLSVGGPDKDKLLEIGKAWGIDIKLPDLPTFSEQQDVISRIQGAYVSTKGILQILGYGVGETITAAGDVAQAAAQGLKDTAKALPKAFNWALIAGAVAVAVVGGALIVYYVPRRPPPPKQLPT
jgi:hypothetical protein